jgi:hypothetical protein
MSVGDGIQAARRRAHQIGERIVVTGDRPLDGLVPHPATAVNVAHLATL